MQNDWSGLYESQPHKAVASHLHQHPFRLQHPPSPVRPVKFILASVHSVEPAADACSAERIRNSAADQLPATALLGPSDLFPHLGQSRFSRNQICRITSCKMRLYFKEISSFLLTLFFLDLFQHSVGQLLIYLHKLRENAPIPFNYWCADQWANNQSCSVFCGPMERSNSETKRIPSSSFIKNINTKTSTLLKASAALCLMLLLSQPAALSSFL